MIISDFKILDNCIKDRCNYFSNLGDSTAIPVTSIFDYYIAGEYIYKIRIPSNHDFTFDWREYKNIIVYYGDIETKDLRELDI